MTSVCKGSTPLPASAHPTILNFEPPLRRRRPPLLFVVVLASKGVEAQWLLSPWFVAIVRLFFRAYANIT